MMVKDDSLYIVAIVAVVAVVGLIIMATGSTVAAEDLPSMVDSDDTAIAGQAFRSAPINKYKTAESDEGLKYKKTDTTTTFQREVVDPINILQIMDLTEQGAINIGGIYALGSFDLTGSRLEGDGSKLCTAVNGQVIGYIDLHNPSSTDITITYGKISSDYHHNSDNLGWDGSQTITSWLIPARGMFKLPVSVSLGDVVDCQTSAYTLCNQYAFDALNTIYTNQQINLKAGYTIEFTINGNDYTGRIEFTDSARKSDWSGSTSNTVC